MHKNVYLSSLVFFALSPTFAAQPLPLQNASLNDLQGFQLMLPRMMKSSAMSPNTLQFVKQHIDQNNTTHMRMQQYYAGFPVFGGFAILHGKYSAQTFSSVPKNVKMNGRVYNGLQTELGQAPVAFRERAKIALQQFKSTFLQNSVQEEHVMPIVYINEQHQAFWAYKVSILINHQDSAPERPTAILKADTLTPLLEWNDLKTIRTPVFGVGYGGNSKIGQYQFGKEFQFLELRRDNLFGVCYMQNKHVKVVDMFHGSYKPNSTMHFPCEQSISALKNKMYWMGYQQDGYDSENGAFSPSNDALYVGGVVHSMYKDWYDLDVLTHHNKPMQLVMRVHFGKNYQNAFWDGQQMTFGDGGSLFYPLVTVGIAAHEISHGFTQQHSDLEYVGQSGGINEAFSDMAAQAAEYYSQGKSSWMIGADIVKESTGFKALRFMDQPSSDGRSIDSADQYEPDMNVHNSSGVYNRLFYLLANQPNWNVKQAFQVMVKANMDYWTPYSTFAEGACGILSAAKDLHLSVDDVKPVLEQVAIRDLNCS